MKSFIILCIVTLTACAQIASLRPNSPDDTKAQVTKLIVAQRAKAEWMSMPSCPVDRMPEKGRRPDSSLNDCAINPERCLQKCDAKDGDACYFLANLIQEHDKIENDVAEVLYQRSCELGVVSGCTNRAANILERNEEKGNVCAAHTFEKACLNDDPWGCTMYGFVVAEGIGRQKNLSEAELLLKKACEISIDKSGGACVRANEVLNMIKKNPTPQ